MERREWERWREEKERDGEKRKREWERERWREEKERDGEKRKREWEREGWREEKERERDGERWRDRGIWQESQLHKRSLAEWQGWSRAGRGRALWVRAAGVGCCAHTGVRTATRG